MFVALGTHFPVWTQTTTDFLSRTLRTERPGVGGAIPPHALFYNAQGQLVKFTTTGKDELFVDEPERVDQLGRRKESAAQHGVRVDLFWLTRVKYANLTPREAVGGFGLATGAGVSYPIRKRYRQMEGLLELRQQHAKATRALEAVCERA